MRVLTVTTEAAEHALLTIDEMRALAGVVDSSEDAALTALGLRSAAAITAECNIAVGAGSNPTLLRETLTETFYSVEVSELILSRRHDVDITSVTVDGTTIASDEYVVNPEAGLLVRLQAGYPADWCARKIVVVYDAGFADVPEDLRQAAMDVFRSAYQDAQRDPLVKSIREDIPGVMERETAYWVGSLPGQLKQGAVPDLVSGKLKRFRNYMISG